MVPRPGVSGPEEFDRDYVIGLVQNASVVDGLAVAFGTLGADVTNAWVFGSSKAPRPTPRPLPSVANDCSALREFQNSVVQQQLHIILEAIRKQLFRGRAGLDNQVLLAANMYKRYPFASLTKPMFDAIFGYVTTAEMSKRGACMTSGTRQRQALVKPDGTRAIADIHRHTAQLPTLASWIMFAGHWDLVRRAKGDDCHFIMPVALAISSFKPEHSLWGPALAKLPHLLLVDRDAKTQGLVSDVALNAAKNVKTVHLHVLDERVVMIAQQRTRFYLCFTRKAVAGGEGKLWEIFPGVKMFGDVGWLPAETVRDVHFPHAHYIEQRSEGYEWLGESCLMIRPSTVVLSSGHLTSE